ncbi:MAG: low-specificity L-threonine aldolase [Candidatus Promineifilaceae bacterium]|jgi:threonine aldolase
MDRIDFRSDTVTWPTPAMREAMASATVGDDVYGEDPTIGELEAVAAQKTGKEAALFVASGTMGNLVSILTHATRGEEVIVGRDSHVMLWEAGSISALGGMVPNTLPTDQYGRMSLQAVEDAIRPDNDHLPKTRLIHVENSYGSKYGYPISPDYFAGIQDIAGRHDLKVHLDGARVFNAAVAQNIDVREITQYADSLTFCLSKGLCAPVGSVICGSTEFIKGARRIRKAVGGGMRQAGILAAAGLVALEQMVDRLDIDHRNACLLAEGLAVIPGIEFDFDRVRTNMVFFNLTEDVPYQASDIAGKMREEANIWVGTTGPRSFRAVTHYWIEEADIELFLDVLSSIIGN